MRYRMVYNGDHWRVQSKADWWWPWRTEHDVRCDDFGTYSLGPRQFKTDTSAKAFIEHTRALLEERRKREAPFTVSVEV